MPADSASRTLVLTVVAVDLVGYSRTSVAEQMSLKDHFNRVLLQAISDIPIADRIILDTGDGVAMGFLGDPEDALYVAMFMHDAINRDSAGSPSGGANGKSSGNGIRIGINLGPVKLATGIGGHPNIIGDGINVAERIMGFAEPGQLTASRPVFEIMSRMSDHYATLFQYAGVHTDKQVRAHDVYLVGKSTAAFRQAERGVAERAAQRAGQPAHLPVIASGISRVPAMPARAPVKAMPPSPAAAGKREGETPATTNKTRTPTPAKSAETASTAAAIGAGERHRPLIDFLEDRNKVAISAFLLVIVAVTLGALLAYRKMRVLSPESSAPAIVALSPAPASKEGSVSVIPPSPVIPAARVPAEGKPALVAKNVGTTVESKVESKLPPTSATGTTSLPTATPAASKPTAASAIPVTPAASAPPSLAAKSPGTTLAPKAEVKSPPSPTTAITMPPATGATATKPNPVTPTVPAASAVPAKVGERPPLPAGKSAPVPDAVRDKPKDPKTEKTERPDKPAVRDDIRNEPRKATPPRTVVEREKSPAASTAPIMPTYQSPAEAPRPETVAPTQKLPSPSVSAANTSVVVVSRSAPPYPIEGIRQSIPSGMVRARIIIDASGNVSDVVILESRPISAFGRETRVTAKQWKYNPGAPGRIHEIEITFKPER